MQLFVHLIRGISSEKCGVVNSPDSRLPLSNSSLPPPSSLLSLPVAPRLTHPSRPHLLDKQILNYIRTIMAKTSKSLDRLGK